MTETLQIVQLAFSFLIVPVLGYIIRLERRITRLETKIEMAFNSRCVKEKEKEQ